MGSDRIETHNMQISYVFLFYVWIPQLSSFKEVMSSASSAEFLPFDRYTSFNCSVWCEDVRVLLMDKALW